MRVVAPLEREVTDYAYFTGRTEAVESVNLQAQVTGYLVSVDFEPGQEVTTGQQLFKIDPRTYQAALDQAEAQIQLAKAQLELADANYKRAIDVAKTPGAISQQDIDRYAAAKSEAEAALAAATANAEVADLNVKYTSVTSPIDGLVGRNLITVGNLVRQNDTLLTTIVSQDPIYAYFDIDEHTLLQLRRRLQQGEIKGLQQGGQVRIDMALADEASDYPHQGVLDFINIEIDASTGTLQARASFDNPPLAAGAPRMFAPGLFVRVRLPLGPPYQALLVPQAALGTDQGMHYLLAVNDQQVVEYRSVELGPQQPDGMQVVFPVKMIKTPDGLRPVAASTPADEATVDSVGPNDRVIVGGLQRVRPGMHVDATKMEPGQPAASMVVAEPQSPESSRPPAK